MSDCMVLDSEIAVNYRFMMLLHKMLGNVTHQYEAIDDLR